MHNPFSPPSARIEDIGAAKGSGIKAVAIGLLVDFGGSALASFLLLFIYSFGLLASGIPENEFMEAMLNIQHNSWVLVIGIVIGFFFSVLGGYFCARVARHSEYKFGLILSGISIILGFPMGIGKIPLLMNIALSIGSFVSVMAGVRLGVSRNRTV